MRLIKLLSISMVIGSVLLSAWSEAVAPGANGKIFFLREGVVQFSNPDGSNLTSLQVFGNRPIGSPNSQLIAFDCYDGDWEICTMNSDGTNVVQLTDNTITDTVAAWSPDGTKIGFSTERDGNFEAYVMNPDGSDPVNLTNNPANDFFGDWSPDGTKITFTTLRDYQTLFFEIYVMNADGSNPIGISNYVFSDQDPSWSPDGTKIVFTRTTNQADIWIMNPDGSDQQNLTNSPNYNEVSAVWSPDGTKIAFNSDQNVGFTQIYVMDPDGNNLVDLINDSVFEGEPSWQPLISQGICPEPQGFWKNNPSEWPVVVLILGAQQYTQTELLSLMDVPAKRDASLILMQQLVAAMLNVANGVDPAPIQNEISQANQLLAPYSGKLPYNVRPNTSEGQSMVTLASTLENYNKGYLTPNCEQ